MEPIYFATPDEFRSWLDAHHRKAAECVVGLFKKGSGLPSITWPEAVDEALCLGWIDGRAHRIDAERWAVRFTPRRPGSIWSSVNVARVAALREEGRMRPEGLAAFARRSEARTSVYSHEQAEEPTLTPEHAAKFEANPDAWAFFSARPPSYQRAAIWWVVSAKRPETREHRLETLIADSAAGQPIKLLRRSSPGT